MTGAIANAVLIRRSLRSTSQRRLAAALQVSTGKLTRVLQSIDSVSAVLDALGLEVSART